MQMKLNKKGYMLVEIVIASVLAFSIAYYLLNLTYDFKNKSEDIYQSYLYTKDKVLITKNIMSDLEKGTVQGIEQVVEESIIKVDFYLKKAGENVEPRRLLFSKSDDGSTIVEYGKISDDSFDEKDVSYYKKKLSSSLIIGDFNDEQFIKFDKKKSSLTVLVPIQSIYGDDDYSIKLYAKYLEVNMMKDCFSSTDYKPKEGEINYQLFQVDDYRENITDVVFEYGVELGNAKISWDLSEKEDESIYAWINEDDSELLHIGATNGEKIYVKNLNSFFRNMTALKNVEFKSLDTSMTIDMSNMFDGCSDLISLDLSNFDTSNVADMSQMFYYCGKLTTEITIRNTATTYGMLFECAATDNDAEIIVNYTSATKDLVSDMIATKSSDSNVVIGVEVDS